MRLVTIVLLTIVSTVSAQTYYINIYLNGEGKISMPIQEIKKLTFSDITQISNDKYLNVVNTLKLLQNYPNPFNPTTNIKYFLPNPGNVAIKIFNVTGELIRILENTYQTQGEHVIIWDAKNQNAQLVAAGLYIYQIVFNNSILTKKMLFIK